MGLEQWNSEHGCWVVVCPLGGNTQFQEYNYSYQQFWSLNEERTVIAMLSFRWGHLGQLGDFKIPAEDRYRIGGMGSIRGHTFGSISGPFSRTEQDRHEKVQVVVDEYGDRKVKSFDARIEDLSPKQLKLLEGGGVSERVLNAELLFPLSRDEQSFVRGVIFFDAGNVNAEPIQYELLGEKEPNFFEVRRSTGAGVRLITPVGVLRFEYGYKLDRRGGESPDRFEFNISGLF